jgi:hypothetical protein
MKSLVVTIDVIEHRDKRAHVNSNNSFVEGRRLIERKGHPTAPDCWRGWRGLSDSPIPSDFESVVHHDRPIDNSRVGCWWLTEDHTCLRIT